MFIKPAEMKGESYSLSMQKINCAEQAEDPVIKSQRGKAVHTVVYLLKGQQHLKVKHFHVKAAWRAKGWVVFSSNQQGVRVGDDIVDGIVTGTLHMDVLYAGNGETNISDRPKEWPWPTHLTVEVKMKKARRRLLPCMQPAMHSPRVRPHSRLERATARDGGECLPSSQTVEV